MNPSISRPKKDDHGQPVAPFLAQHLNNASKALVELAAICTGIVCDGDINDKEAKFFHDWIHRHVQYSDILWFRDLRERVARIFNDGKVDPDEREELRLIMEHVRGGGDLSVNYSTPLPLDDPPPTPVQFLGRAFCVTGKFAYGKRSKVVEMIATLGGTATDGQPARHTNYLVIGRFCSRDWKEPSYGTKIMRAVELRSQGTPIHLISEDHWRNFVAGPFQYTSKIAPPSVV